MDSAQSGGVSRRDFVAATGGGIAGMLAGVGTTAIGAPAAASAPGAGAANPGTAAATQPAGDASLIGKPVSDTARAQGGDPKIPGPPDGKAGYAIVGLGKLAVGQVLPAFAFCQRSRPVALVSGSRDKARLVAQHFGMDPEKTYTYDTFDQLRSNPEVDIVYVITPNTLHEEWTMRAAGAGKHVLCEKPMSNSVESCRRMIDACRNAGKKLMIGYRVHYEPFNRTMMELTRAKRFGPVRLVSTDTVQDVGGPGQPRLDPKLGGGSLWDIGIYSVNAARYLTQEEPEEVTAMRWSDPKDERFKSPDGKPGGGVDESMVFTLRFPSGALAHCSSSFGSATVNRYRVVGTRGWYGLDPATTYSGLRAFTGDEHGELELKLTSVNHFAAEMDHFSQCVLNNKDPDTPGEEGLRDVALIQRIYESAEMKQTVRVG